MPRWIHLVVFLTICAGTTVRFLGLGRKTVWFDEVFSVIILRGETPTAFVASTFDGLTTADSVSSRLQSKPPGRLRDVISDQIAHDTHHVPFYYGGLNEWARRFGSTVADLRLLSALASVAALGAAAWAGMEMGGERMSVILVAIVAVSPLHLAYAQEAREYALWSAALFFQFGALVRALRRDTTASWAACAATTAFAFYCQELTLLVVAAQAVALAVFRVGWNRRSVLALAAALLACSPWLVVMVRHRGVIVAATDWMTHGVPRAEDLLSAVRNWSWAFLSLPPSFPATERTAFSIALTVLAIAIAAIALRRADRPLVAVLAAGLVSVAIPFMVMDMVDGGRRAVQVRYNFPGIIALEAALAFFLAAAPPRRRAAGLLALLLVGGATDVRYIRADDWSTKLMSDRALMNVVNSTMSPVIVIDSRDEQAAIRLAAVATGLRSDTLLVRTRPGAMSAVPDWRHKNVFVPWPTPEMESWARSEGGEPVRGNGTVYRLPPHWGS